MNKSQKKLIGSLSRACGNDFISYRKDEDKVILYFWPPIAQEVANGILDVSKAVDPKLRVRVNKKKGIITVS
jgi:hypothetical protein